MKYAKEVIELLAAYPGRDWKMAQVIREVSGARSMTLKERQRLRVGVARVLSDLGREGIITIKPPMVRRGGYALYRWGK